jgi:hypothetical protein
MHIDGRAMVLVGAFKNNKKGLLLEIVDSD